MNATANGGEDPRRHSIPEDSEPMADPLARAAANL
jgi:hypothetical protein